MLETDIGIAAYNHLKVHDALWCFRIEKLLIIIWKAVIKLCNEGSICLYESYSIFISLIYRMMPDIDWHLKLHRKSKAWYNAGSGACYVKTASEICHKLKVWCHRCAVEVLNERIAPAVMGVSEASMQRHRWQAFLYFLMLQYWRLEGGLAGKIY